ncbi:uncharacterized protein RJT20DRAFT_124993 [Scheffersomyces xylosifermentans]|uniref:uncharacterized protein n=1 Tax=Scheffersomyces xylosifermentans TaxID=1304137 RepID=UPI00315C7D97
MSEVRTSIVRYISAFFLPDNTLQSRQRWILGLINLAAVVVFWVLSSFLVNSMVEDDIYRKPFFITYINTGCFCFYIIPYLKFEGLTVKQFISKLKEDYYISSIPQKTTDEESLMNEYGSNDDLAGLSNENSLHIRESGSEYQDNEEIGVYETVKLSLQFIILWFSANLVTNSSLSYTSVASQTILSSTSSFFTLIIGYLHSVERINQNKIVGILLSFTGVAIVTRIDSSNENPNNHNSNLLVLWGNALALSGALIYGIYTILLKQKISIKNSRKERNLNTHLFFGFVGIFCLVFLWPILIVLHFTGYETFEMPPSKQILWILLINAFVTFVSDFCWCKAVLLTSPLTVTVGLSMTIPLAMVGDWLLKGFSVNVWYVFGAAIVTIGFLIINKDEEDDFVREE